MSHLGSIRGRGEPIGPCLRDLAKSKELDDGFDFFGLLVSNRSGPRASLHSVRASQDEKKVEFQISYAHTGAGWGSWAAEWPI